MSEKRGMINIMILLALKEKDLTAYHIKKEISDQSYGVYTPSSGVLYPTLRSLMDENLIELKEQNDRKIYTITKNGRTHIEEKIKTWKKIMSSRTEGFHYYGKIGLEIKMLTKTIYALPSNVVSDKSDKIVTIIRDAETKIKELW